MKVDSSWISAGAAARFLLALRLFPSPQQNPRDLLYELPLLAVHEVSCA